MTGNIYNITGEALKVREEIFNYTADILKRVSPSTALEMRIELNKYHIQRLGLTVPDVKQMLGSINFYQPAQTESGSFNDKIEMNFIEAMLKFQEAEKMSDADGVVGPKTLELLKIKSNVHN